MDDIRDFFRRQGLVRTRDGILGGVCAGIGRRIGLAPWPTRWLFILTMIVFPGSQILVYPALWILMPQDEPVSAWPVDRPRAPEGHGG